MANEKQHDQQQSGQQSDQRDKPHSSEHSDENLKWQPGPVEQQKRSQSVPDRSQSDTQEEEETGDSSEQRKVS